MYELFQLNQYQLKQTHRIILFSLGWLVDNEIREDNNEKQSKVMICLMNIQVPQEKVFSCNPFL